MSGENKDEIKDDAHLRLSDLLRAPRESLDLEIKGWLDLSDSSHRADLGKALLALANHGGGYVIVGYSEVDGGWVVDASRPNDLEAYSQDAINGIVQKFADPVFHCDVHLVPHPSSNELFPIVSVPGGHRFPIRSRRSGPNEQHIISDRYYIRRPGPKSEPPQSGQEWDDLMRRCVLNTKEDLVESIRNVISGISPDESGSSKKNGSEPDSQEALACWEQESIQRFTDLCEEKLANENPSRYSHGVWTVSYLINGDVSSPTLSQLDKIARDIKGWETGWPVWLVVERHPLSPYPANGVVECFLVEDGVDEFSDGFHSDFWRISPEGKAFLLRGYQDDSPRQNFEPSTRFALTIPVWRVAEALLHARRYALAISTEDSSILFKTTWSGLNGRVLSTWASPHRFPLMDDRIARQDKVSSQREVFIDEIEANLPEVVHSIVRPLFEVFDFYEISPQLVAEEISRIRTRR